MLLKLKLVRPPSEAALAQLRNLDESQLAALVDALKRLRVEALPLVGALPSVGL